MSIKVAQLISILLGPQIWLPVLFFIIIFRLGAHPGLFFSILFLQVIIPLAYLYLAPKLGLGTHWDLPKRQERYPFLAIVLIGSLISLFLSYQFGTKFLFDLNSLTVIFLIVFFLITLYWQISLHTALNTFGAILVNFLFDWNLAFLYLTIPTILWARLTLKRHTLSQLMAGIIISAIITLGGLYLLGALYGTIVRAVILPNYIRP